MKKIQRLSVALIFSLLFSSFFSQAQTIYSDCVDGVIYFKVYDNSSVTINYQNPPHDLSMIITAYSITNISKPFRLPDIPLQNIYKAVFSNAADVDNIISSLSALAYVEYAEKAPLYTVSYTPNDYHSANQWSLQRVDAPTAWGVSTGSAAVKIAIVDNAVNYQHEDLIANAWTNPGEVANNGLDDDLNGYTDDVHGYDLADGDNNPLPPPGTLNTSAFTHGTHCAGIASAVTDNNMGIASLGFRAKIISVKCATDGSNGNTLTNAFEGVDYAISAGADVVSMSFGSTSAALTWQFVINSAQTRGVVLVAAAGNDNSSTLFYPAAFPYVIAVGSTDGNDHRSSFSNFGSWIDVMAPGEGILSTLPQNGNTYGYLSGTSMACPLVAGLAGLVLSINTGFSEAQVENYIKSGCDNIDGINPGYQGQLGSGRINAGQAMGMATGSVGINENALTVFSVYPNPGNGNFFIESHWENNNPVTMVVYGVDGKMVFSQLLNNLSPDGRESIALHNVLSPGSYVLNFICDEHFIQSYPIIVSSE